MGEWEGGGAVVVVYVSTDDHIGSNLIRDKKYDLGTILLDRRQTLNVDVNLGVFLK